MNLRQKSCIRKHSTDPTNPTSLGQLGQLGQLGARTKCASHNKVSSSGFTDHSDILLDSFEDRYEIYFATEKKPPFFEVQGSSSRRGPSEREGKDFRIISKSLGLEQTPTDEQTLSRLSRASVLSPSRAHKVGSLAADTPPLPTAGSLGAFPSNPRKIWNDQFESGAFSAHLKSLKYSSEKEPTSVGPAVGFPQRRKVPLVHRNRLEPNEVGSEPNEVGSSEAALERGRTQQSGGKQPTQWEQPMQFEQPTKFSAGTTDENFVFPHDDLKSSLILRPFEMYPNERHFIGKTDNFSLKIASSAQIERVGTREKLETREGRSVLVRYGEVENSETVSYKDFKNPHPGGLYCSRIFGPIKNWVCTHPGCSDTKKGIGTAAAPVSRKGNDEFLGAPDGRGKYREFKCSVCGNGLYPSTLRRYRMGYIHLYQPLVHVSYIHSRQNLFAHLLRWSTKEIHSLIYNNLNLINFGHTELFSACFAPLFGFCEDSLGEALEWLRGDYFSLSDQATVVLRLLQPTETQTAERLSKAQTKISDSRDSSPQLGGHQRAHEKTMWTKKWPEKPDPILLSTAWRNSQNFPTKIESLFCPEIATVDTLLLEDQNFFLDILSEWKQIFSVPSQEDLTRFQKFQLEIFEQDPSPFETLSSTELLEPLETFDELSEESDEDEESWDESISWVDLPSWVPDLSETFLHLFESPMESESHALEHPAKLGTAPNKVGNSSTQLRWVSLDFLGSREQIQALDLSEAFTFPDLEIFYHKTFGTLESFLKDPERMYSEKFIKNSFFVLQDFLTKFQNQFFAKNSRRSLPTSTANEPIALADSTKLAAVDSGTIRHWNPMKFHSGRRFLDFMCFRKDAKKKSFLRASGFSILPIWSSSSQRSGLQDPLLGGGDRLETARRHLQDLLSRSNFKNESSPPSWRLEPATRVTPNHIGPAKVSKRIGKSSHLKANHLDFFGSKGKLKALAQMFKAKKGFQHPMKWGRISFESNTLEQSKNPTNPTNPTSLGQLGQLGQLGPYKMDHEVGIAGFENFQRKKEKCLQKLLGELQPAKANLVGGAHKGGSVHRVSKQKVRNRRKVTLRSVKFTPFQSLFKMSETREILAKPYFAVSGIAQKITRPKKQAPRSGLGFSLPLSHPAFAQNFVTSFDLSTRAKIKCVLENQVKKPSKIGRLASDFLPPGNALNSLKLFERSRIFDRNDVLEECEYFLGPQNGFFEKSLSLQFLSQENEFHNLLAFLEASPFFLKEQNRFAKRVHSVFFNPFLKLAISRFRPVPTKSAVHKVGAGQSTQGSWGSPQSRLLPKKVQQSLKFAPAEPQTEPQNSWNFSPRGTIRQGDLLYGWLPSEHMMQRLIKLLGNASLGTNSPEVILSQKPLEIFTVKKNKTLVYGWTFQKLLKGQDLNPFDKKAKSYFALKSSNPLRGIRSAGPKQQSTRDPLGSFQLPLKGARKGAGESFDSSQLEKEGTRFALSSFHRQLQNLLFQKQIRNGFQDYHCEDGATLLTGSSAAESETGLEPTNPKNPKNPTSLGQLGQLGQFAAEPEYDLNFLFDLKSPDDFGPWKRWPEFAKFFLYNGGPTLKKYFRSQNWPQTALMLRKRIRRADPSVVLTKKISKLFEIPQYMGISPEKWKTFLFSKVNRTKPGLIKEKLNNYFREQRAILLAEEKHLKREIREESKANQKEILFWMVYDEAEPERHIAYEEKREKDFRRYKKNYRQRQKAIEKLRAQQVRARERMEAQQRKEREKQQRALERAQLKLQKEKEKEKKQQEKSLKKQLNKLPTPLPTPLGMTAPAGVANIVDSRDPLGGQEPQEPLEISSPASSAASSTASSTASSDASSEEKFFETDEELFKYFIKFEYPPYEKKMRRNSVDPVHYANLFLPGKLEVENTGKIAILKARRKQMRGYLVYIDAINIEKVFEQFPFSPEDVGWSTNRKLQFGNTLSNPLWRNFLIHEMFRRNSLRDQQKLVKKDLVWEDFVTFESYPLDVNSLHRNPITSATPRGCLCRMNALFDFDQQIKRYDLTTRKADKKKADQYYQRFHEYLKALQHPVKSAREIGPSAENIQINPQFPFKKRIRKISDKKRLVKQYRAVLTLLKNPSCIERGIFDKFPILPPDLRPILQLGDVKAVSDMTSLYILLIQRNIRHGKILFESYGESNEFLIDSKTMVQVAADNALDKCREKNVNNLIVGRMLDYKDSATQLEQWASAKPKTKGPGTTAPAVAPRTLYDRLSGKEGRFRMNLLGKRVDYSGRSVIIVGPSLNVDQCGVPYEMAFELFQPFVLRYMLEDPDKKVQKYLQYDPWIPDDTILDHLKLSAQRGPQNGLNPPETSSGTDNTRAQLKGANQPLKLAPHVAGPEEPKGPKEPKGHLESIASISLETSTNVIGSEKTESLPTSFEAGDESSTSNPPSGSEPEILSDTATEIVESNEVVPVFQAIRPIKSLSQAKLILRKKKALGRMILRQIVPRFPVLLNRAPTLHRLGIQGFHPVLVYGRALHLHPLVCGSFNADFDGDQMAVHIPLSLKARFDIRMLMFAPVNWLSPATGQPTVVPSQDMVLGLFYMTLEKIALQKGRGAFFNTLSDAVQAYQTGMLEIQSQIWVRWNGPFANNQMNDESSEEIYEEHAQQGKAHSLRLSVLATTSAQYPTMLGNSNEQSGVVEMGQQSWTSEILRNQEDFQFRRKPFFPENQMKFWKGNRGVEETGANFIDKHLLPTSLATAAAGPVKQIFFKKDLLILRKALQSAKETRNIDHDSTSLSSANFVGSSSLRSGLFSPFGTAGEMTVRVRWWNDFFDTRLFSAALNGPVRKVLAQKSLSEDESAATVHSRVDSFVKESWFETSRRQKRRRESGPVKYGRQKGFFYHSFGRFSNDEDEPIEIRIHQTGNSRKIYPDFQWLEDSKEESSSRISYIRTTPGRALMNQLIYPAYEE